MCRDGGGLVIPLCCRVCSRSGTALSSQYHRSKQVTDLVLRFLFILEVIDSERFDTGVFKNYR